jgi:hypothetical protein
MVFTAWQTHYLHNVSAAGPMQIFLSLLFLELSVYYANAVRLHVYAADVLVRCGVDRGASDNRRYARPPQHSWPSVQMRRMGYLNCRLCHLAGGLLLGAAAASSVFALSFVRGQRGVGWPTRIGLGVGRLVAWTGSVHAD